MNKEKTNELKHKQSINTNTSRTSDESNITVRSISGNPKETPRKVRRATTDNGRPKVSSIQIIIIININIKFLVCETTTRNIIKNATITKTKFRSKYIHNFI
jgi:hypothetical protein